MICHLMSLAEIADELNQMYKGETTSILYYVHGSRCYKLKIDLQRSICDDRLSPEIREMCLPIRDLAQKLEQYFNKLTITDNELVGRKRK